MTKSLVRGIRRLLLGGSSRFREVPLYKRVGYKTVFDDASMTVLEIPGKRDDCIVSFTGVGHALGGLDLQNPEFSRGNDEDHKIFVIDKQRSWGNNLDWNRLEAVVKELVGQARITTLGNSMGGFLAILSARRFQATRTIAFAPQWSIDNEILPEENRWNEYRSNIASIRYPDLSAALDGPTRFDIFFGDDPADEVHLRRFPRGFENVRVHVLEDCGHDVARFLRDEGQLYPVIAACRKGDEVHEILAAARLRLKNR